MESESVTEIIFEAFDFYVYKVKQKHTTYAKGVYKLLLSLGFYLICV